MPEPKKQKPCDDEDEITIARSILDDIIEETESDDWDEEKLPNDVSTKEPQPTLIA